MNILSELKKLKSNFNPFFLGNKNEKEVFTRVLKNLFRSVFTFCLFFHIINWIVLLLLIIELFFNYATKCIFFLSTGHVAKVGLVTNYVFFFILLVKYCDVLPHKVYFRIYFSDLRADES